ncbi:DNA replication and repair protein RecF [termite gut metagenome]|uniref:DNA replication and repair protein RecF n=1 Tax=termite gut metagenome TaxID=433724 RepID=A0A5J4T1N1_9ZZZZ
MIKNIQIENYKSIRKLDLDLRPINILIGENGAGKSNFLGFFEFLRSIANTRMQLFVAEKGGAENILYYGSKNSKYLSGKIEFGIIDINLPSGYQFLMKPNNEERFYYEEEWISFYDLHKDNTPYWTLLLGSGYNESKLNSDSLVWKYMDSFRVYHFHDTTRTSKMRKSTEIYDNRFLREDGANLPAYLYLMQEKYPKDFKKIEMLVRMVAPYFERFNLQPDEFNEDKIQLEWKEKYFDAYFRANHLSDGTLRFIALAALLLTPKIPEVIIIDEPELGLHPSAINILAELIKEASTRTQIIMSTQSVNFIDNFEPEDIIVVDKENDGQSIFKRQNTEELRDWLEEYSIGDLWNKNVIGGRP